MGQINDLCVEAHEQAIDNGFYDDQDDLHRPPSEPELLCLIHSEISEALECYRKSEMEIEYASSPEDPRHPTGFPIEIADTVIRIFDLCAYLGIDLEDAIDRKMTYNRTRPFRHGGKIL